MQIHHTPIPQAFIMDATTDDGWELRIVISRGTPMEDDPSVDKLGIVVAAKKEWQQPRRFRRADMMTAEAGIYLEWNDCGRIREELSFAETELDMIGLGKARAFLAANTVRIEDIVARDDLINSDACKCGDCRYGSAMSELMRTQPDDRS